MSSPRRDLPALDGILRSVLLPDQVAIVTGAGRGLGRAVALALAEHGASVVLASRNAPELDEVVKEIRRSGGHALAQTADVADERQVRELVLAAERWVGPATIVVNNAGTVEPIGPLARSDTVAWLHGLAINVGGSYLVSRAALPGMLERGYGRIVNVSSAAAKRPRAGWTAYGAAKAAIEQLTRNLGLELEGTGVAVCAFDPGAMDTAMQGRLRRAAPEDLPTVRQFVTQHAEGRLRDPREPALAITYLVSPAASPNGSVLSVGDEDLMRAVAATLAS